MAAKNRTVYALRFKRMAFSQSENALLDYFADYGAELQGDTIDTSEWLDETGGLTISNESNTTSIATAFISANSPGHYIVTNKITSVGGRTIEVTFAITVTDNETGLSAPDPQTGDYCG